MAELNSCFNTIYEFKKKIECDHLIIKDTYYNYKNHRKEGTICFMCEKCLKRFEPKQLKKIDVNVFVMKK